jgi:hypothetical protein
VKTSMAGPLLRSIRIAVHPVATELPAAAFR